jgi:arsenate reductase (glutaredoxin)
MIRVYAYDKCSTCRDALKFLAARGIQPEVIPIRERPPTKADLKRMLEYLGGELRRLFNTSGQDYKALNMKDKLPGMSGTEVLDLLSRNGNLVKRPFLLTKNAGAVGFKEDEWLTVIRSLKRNA